MMMLNKAAKLCRDSVSCGGLCTMSPVMMGATMPGIVAMVLETEKSTPE